MTWVSMRIRPSQAGTADAVSQALFEAGCEAVQEEGDSLLTNFPDNASALRAWEAVAAADPSAALDTAPLPEVDWTHEWKSRLVAHRAGSFVVAPPWLADTLDGSPAILIDPGMAFGTGDHPTTRGAIRLLETIVQPGDFVADLGAGSAVLAIAAAKLGATRLAAIELDPDAIGNAEANVARNGCAATVCVIEGDAATILPLLGSMRVIVANIVSSVLVPLLPMIRECLAPGGEAVLGGFLVEEAAVLRSAIVASGLRAVREDEEGGWWTVALAVA